MALQDQETYEAHSSLLSPQIRPGLRAALHRFNEGFLAFEEANKRKTEILNQMNQSLQKIIAEEESIQRIIRRAMQSKK